jgi:hydroxyacylglutathione hydrolase
MVQIHGVPAFEDNYLWVIEDGRNAAVVDPGDASPVGDFLDARGLALTAILATHHHKDHVGGLAALAARGGVEVFGPASERIAGVTRPLAGGERIDVPGLGLSLDVIAVPGHTAGHIAYAGDGFVFCGDTLFAGGCGRLFEGTAAQMAASLAKLAALPPATRVYCAHEYTLANLRFAQAVEPGNARLARRFLAESDKRARGEPTVPSTLALEIETNPFLRAHVPEVAGSAARHAGHPLATPLEVFAAVREWKNAFR